MVVLTPTPTRALPHVVRPHLATCRYAYYDAHAEYSNARRGGMQVFASTVMDHTYDLVVVSPIPESFEGMTQEETLLALEDSTSARWTSHFETYGPPQFFGQGRHSAKVWKSTTRPTTHCGEGGGLNKFSISTGQVTQVPFSPSTGTSTYAKKRHAPCADRKYRCC